MKMKALVGLATVLLMFGMFGMAQATSVSLFVDAAPNVYGSPDYDPWQASSFASAAAGTFVNMQNSINPNNVGTTNFEIQDEVVYSFGDLGKRLTWIYFLDGVSKSDLEGTGRFEISLTTEWDGAFSDFYLDYFGSTWLEPTKWIDYDDGTNAGVIGTAGMAWWGAHGVNTQDALDADIAAWGLAEESWTFTARLDGEETSITSHREAVPEPGTMLLFGTCLVSLIGSRIRRKKK